MTNDTLTRTIQVNARPAAVFSVSPPVALQGEMTRFDASESVDSDGRIVAYEWDLDGDGVTDAQGRAVSHAFEAVGNHPVTPRVVDDGGAANTTTRSVLVNDRPTVSYTGPSSAAAGTPVALSTTVTDEIGSTTGTWQFPDGTSANGTSVTHTFEPGQHELSVIVEDEYGARSVQEVTLSVRAATGTTATPPAETTQSPPEPGPRRRRDRGRDSVERRQSSHSG